MQIYNTLTRKKEKLIPLQDNLFRIYSCGPTVYDYVHIGNLRAFVCADILKRYLIFKGYKVKHVMNITDVDDKTIKKANGDMQKLKEITEFYTKAFFEDLNEMNILPADVYPKATEHIPEMVEMIKTLMEKGYAYKAEDGSIYFSVAKFKD
ncbi:MAG TPA: cysteine--tRNA ligase, partial [Candidatus Woesearchaeota archaeon]|nr:cysteine--tRNA ligase [Candidatus Woesearchaeota archaeon]